MAGIAALLITLATGCAGTHATGRTAVRSTPRPTPYSGGLQTLAPDSSPTPTPSPLTAYGRELYLTDAYLGSTDSLDTECEELRSSTCADAARSWELIVAGSALRIESLGPPGPEEPKLADALDVLRSFMTALQQVVRASTEGGEEVYGKARADVEAAVTRLNEVWGDLFSWDRLIEVEQAPAAAPEAPFPPGAGGAPTARDRYTQAVEKLYADAQPILARISTACTAVLSDGCAAAIDPYEVAINDVASRLRRIAPAMADGDGDAAFGAAVFELQEAITPLRRATSSGGNGEGGFAHALLHDGAWRLRDALSILRDGAPGAGLTV